MPHTSKPLIIEGLKMVLIVSGDYRYLQFTDTANNPLNGVLGMVTIGGDVESRQMNWNKLNRGELYADGSLFYELVIKINEEWGQKLDLRPPGSSGWQAKTSELSPAFLIGTAWDAYPCLVPYSSLLKILTLGRKIAEGSLEAIEKLIQAQAGIPIEELLKSPNVKTGTWLDDEFPCCPEENPDVKEPYPYRNPPQPKGRDALELVEEVVDQTGRYVYSHNKIDQSIADGNRDFAIRVLKNNGLYPKPTDEQGLEKVARLKLKDVPKLLEAMGRLNLYAASEERRRWNPEALATDSLAETLVSYDWFLYQRLPSEWDEFDALARLERIFKDEKPTSPGFIYTKLFGLRLRMIVRMELNERLVLAAAEEMEL
jgi:hypothetical protein